jgi:c-di-GMP-binding flagellar brake protein YcgR
LAKICYYYSHAVQKIKIKLRGIKMAQKERRFVRVKPSTEIKVFSLNGVVSIGRLLDVSPGGAKIGMDMAPHYCVGNEINIAFLLSDPKSDKKGPVFARGKVAWQKKYPNFGELGMEFDEMLPSHQERIREFIGST